MAHVVFYEKPGCGGNARQKQVLSDSGHTLEVRNLLAEAWSGTALLAFFGTRPVAEWFNRSHPKVKSGEIVPETMAAGEALTLMLADPLFIRRPLLQVEERREVGWDEALMDSWIGLKGAGLKEGCPKGDDAHRCP
jgi:nitrogenase-associated protein